MLSVQFAYPAVMRYFEEISAIPRASYKEEGVADYLVAFARRRGLEYYRDETNNVLINLPATPDRVTAAPVLLQGHTDMVCEKNAGVAHDFDVDPIRLREEGGWIRADGTTLGADNGIAVAMMLAILDGGLSSHPALQCLFTASEEVGMDGAMAFDYGRIFARRMINMDSADESCMIAGCAGGLRTQVTLPVTRAAASGAVMVLKVRGLFGGHSGEDVNRGRANANKLLGRVLWELWKADGGLRLVSAVGGSKDNAIPREAEAVICVSDPAAAQAQVATLETLIRDELVGDDRNFCLELVPCACDGAPLDAQSTRAVISLTVTAANGVFAMNRDLPNLVEFSRNLGVLRVDGDTAEWIFSSRSARDSQIDQSASELDALAAMIGGTTWHHGRYPGWNFDSESAFRRSYIDAYRKLLGREPRIEVIHAGVECGLIKQRIPDMDLFSCGPIITDLHSPDEALDVASFERFVTIIFDLLRNC